jgi:polyhydroxybutyrate depolymerase
MKFLFLSLWIFVNCLSIENTNVKSYRVTDAFGIEYNGQSRNYLVYTPDDYNSQKKYPLLFVFHGARGNAKDMQTLTEFDKIAQKEKLIIVYPYGSTNLETPSFFWNAFDCCGYAVENKIDDIGFVKKLIQVLKEDYSVDPQKIYATGFSNGGMLSIKLACEISDEFAAVATVGAAMFDLNCFPSRPIPIFFIQGKKDIVVPYEGGVGVNSSTKKAKLPAETSFLYWSKMHGCESEKSIETDKTIQLIASNCTTGAEVKLVAVKEEKHTWPKENYPASWEVWSFLKKWTKPKAKVPA